MGQDNAQNQRLARELFRMLIFIIDALGDRPEGFFRQWLAGEGEIYLKKIDAFDLEFANHILDSETKSFYRDAIYQSHILARADSGIPIDPEKDELRERKKDHINKQARVAATNHIVSMLSEKDPDNKIVDFLERELPTIKFAANSYLRYVERVENEPLLREKPPVEEIQIVEEKKPVKEKQQTRKRKREEDLDDKTSDDKIRTEASSDANIMEWLSKASPSLTAPRVKRAKLINEGRGEETGKGKDAATNHAAHHFLKRTKPQVYSASGGQPQALQHTKPRMTLLELAHQQRAAQLALHEERAPLSRHNAMGATLQASILQALQTKAHSQSCSQEEESPPLESSPPQLV